MAIEPLEGVTVPYEGTEIAYSGDQFNEVLESYGLILTIEAAQNVPPCFASVKGDTIQFGCGYHSLQCSPKEYHAALTAYGLTLTADDVSSRLGKIGTYAMVQDGMVIFNENIVLLWSSDWKIILGAYKKSP